MASYIKLDDFEKNLIEEISIMSGYSPTIVRDILESTYLRQLEFLLESKEIKIPFLGKVLIKHSGEDWISGTKLAKVDSFFVTSDLTKRFVGEIHDGNSPTLNSLVQKKIRGTLQNILDKE